MDLFGTKKNTKPTKQASAKSAPTASATRKAALGLHHDVIQAPWLSEKALIGTENGVYVFKVPTAATKPEIAAAIESIYNVVPKQVRIVNLPAKKKALRSRRGFGVRAARHKAYVSLKKGDTIQF